MNSSSAIFFGTCCWIFSNLQIFSSGITLCYKIQLSGMISEYWIRWKFETFSGELFFPFLPPSHEIQIFEIISRIVKPRLLESTIQFLKCTNRALGYSLDLCSANKRGFPPNANKRGGNPLSGHCIQPTFSIFIGYLKDKKQVTQIIVNLDKNYANYCK